MSGELRLNVIDKVRKNDIPEQTRIVHNKGFKRSLVWRPLVDALDELDRFEALKVRHNARSPQMLHAKLKTFLAANPDLPEIKVAVRGDIAYFWVE